MVNTTKFSQFTTINLNTTNKWVGLSGGANSIADFPLTWTTATRPSSPANGVLGFNTTIENYEWWNANISMWIQLGTGEPGTVTQVNTGTGLTGGPITTTGTVSFASIAANSLWANVTAGIAVPTVIPTSTFLISADNLSDVPNKATARTNMGLAIGTNVEAWSATLDQIAAGTWTGANSITTLGTITAGTWNSTPITVPYGGTGNTTFTAYSVICAGTTATGTFQNVVGVGSANQVLVSQGAGALPQWASVPGLTPAALTRVDDTNVTLTLGGTPATALLQATSITAGWTGQLSLARGGTNANLTASNGGIVYSTATAMAILSGTATANQVLLSGSSAAPAWSTATYPATTTINQLLYSSSNNVIVGLATANSKFLTTDSSGVPSLTNDYVYSTYTPTVTLVGGAGNTVPVYTVNSGRYLNIGNGCWVDVTLEGDGGAEGAGTGVVNIALPITANASLPANTNGRWIQMGSAVNGASQFMLVGTIGASGTTVALRYWSAIGTISSFTGDLQNNTTRNINLSFYYEV